MIKPFRIVPCKKSGIPICAEHFLGCYDQAIQYAEIRLNELPKCDSVQIEDKDGIISVMSFAE